MPARERSITIEERAPGGGLFGRWGRAAAGGLAGWFAGGLGRGGFWGGRLAAFGGWLGGFRARFLGHTPSFRRFPQINH